MSAHDVTEQGDGLVAPGDARIDAETGGVTFLSAADLHFTRSPGGVLRLTMPTVCHRSVTVSSTQPLSHPDEYLSLCVGDDEIGILRQIDELAPDQQALIREELRRRYFQPVIRRVVELTDHFGSYHWDVETDVGRIAFDAQHPRHSVLSLGDGRWLVRASDQNRYLISDVDRMDKHSQRVLREVLL